MGPIQFREVVFNPESFTEICPETSRELQKTRNFIDFLLEKNIEVYGVTTGLADLRNQKVNPAEAAQFSHNLIESHDAGIGPFQKESQ